MTLSVRIAAVLAVPVAALVVSACGTEPQAAPPSSAASSVAPADHDADDVAFARHMIPHHRQAVELSALVPARSTDPDVAALATQISAAQQPEIDTMTGWLQKWGESTDPGHGHAQMAGMVDAATMERLKGLSGAEFDRLWLTSMIAHHRGAIEMAKAEIANGVNRDAIAMAETIVATQQSEIDRMQRMLGQ